MTLALKLGVGLVNGTQPQTVAAILVLLITWADLSLAGTNPRTWEQLASKTWNELT